MENVLLNSNLKPSEVNVRWIYCRDEDIDEKAGSYDDPDLNGKWMMFFKKGDEMDQKWKEACDLYRQGKLDGIRCMKVSAGLHDPERASDDIHGVICFYCGPANDEAALMTYGKSLLRNISYNSKFMRYKSDKQTRAGTFATGQKVNSMYTIKVSDIDLPTSSSHGYSNSSQNSNNRRWYAPNKMNSESNWREQQNSSSTRTSNQNWRERTRPEETNWRSGNRHQGQPNKYAHSRENNWRQTTRNQADPSSSESDQNWRRNNTKSNEN